MLKTVSYMPSILYSPSQLLVLSFTSLFITRIRLSSRILQLGGGGGGGGVERVEGHVSLEMF